MLSNFLLIFAVKLLSYSGCQPVHCTSELLYYAVKLCLIFLVVNLFIVLFHLCTVHAKSVMNYACVMFCPCPSPIFKIYVSEILYERVFILNYVI